ncbi:cytochrome c [Pelomonas sp. APW6]|uniref:Cytochrome c n=1 Tax=Roseateles subflavus TaxID=3053353 RepID=A0ABT7LGW0_9BURK|nr:cytochrome c [Pelomonas sp. APW6]MDL5032084.1 cytochrome c [Pelomonas sp. APW6]
MARPDPAPSRRPALLAMLLGLGLGVGTGAVAQGAANGLDAQMQRGRALFTGKAAPPCALCHTLAAAGSDGQIGPVLDELKPDAARVRRVLQSGLGVMPSYAGKLDAADMEALAQFVSRSAGTAAP